MLFDRLVVIPRGVRFVADVPRTPSPHGEKVQRVKLREMALEGVWGSSVVGPHLQ